MSLTNYVAEADFKFTEDYFIPPTVVFQKFELMFDVYFNIESENMMPLVRTRSLFVQDIGSEVLILDESKNQCYCLNKLTSMVWRKCDGHHSIKDIANQIEKEVKKPKNDFHFQGLVSSEVEKLKRLQLIEESYLQASDALSCFRDDKESTR